MTPAPRSIAQPPRSMLGTFTQVHSRSTILVPGKPTRRRGAARVLAALLVLAALPLAVRAARNPARLAPPSAAPAAPTDPAEHPLPPHPLFGKLAIYRTEPHPACVAVFASGDGGWNLGVVDMARALAARGALVVGFSTPRYLANSDAGSGKCLYAAADLEDLSHGVQQALGYPEYVTPVLVGYSSGATLAYAALAAAPVNTFVGALSLGFCPDLENAKAWCKGNGPGGHPLPAGKKGWIFEASPQLPAPWVVLEGASDAVCDAKATQAFVAKTGGGSLVSLPHVGHGFAVQSSWMPQFEEAFATLAAHPPGAAPEPRAEMSSFAQDARNTSPVGARVTPVTAAAPLQAPEHAVGGTGITDRAAAASGAVAPAGTAEATAPSQPREEARAPVAGAASAGEPAGTPAAATTPSDPGAPKMPIVELAPVGKAKDLLAVIYSGDGGWAGLDKNLGEALAASGVPVVGIDSLHYFWHARTPDSAAADLTQLLRHLTASGHSERFVLAGYSFGADVLPFLVNRLPDDLRRRIAVVGLLGLSSEADFEMHFTSWFGKSLKSALPTKPEVDRLDHGRVLCFVGSDEKDSACGTVMRKGVRIVQLEGGHHFGGKITPIADALVADGEATDP